MTIILSKTFPMESHKIPGRMVVFTRDVQNLTGYCRRTSKRMLDRVRLAYAKDSRDLVTINEFCSFYNLEEEEVRRYMKN
jgi:hypothetical protein